MQDTTAAFILMQLIKNLEDKIIDERAKEDPSYCFLRNRGEEVQALTIAAKGLTHGL